jgi:uncharacterized protein YfdQ (DUF2303 family)
MANSIKTFTAVVEANKNSRFTLNGHQISKKELIRFLNSDAAYACGTSHSVTGKTVAITTPATTY